MHVLLHAEIGHDPPRARLAACSRACTATRGVQAPGCAPPSPTMPRPPLPPSGRTCSCARAATYSSSSGLNSPSTCHAEGGRALLRVGRAYHQPIHVRCYCLGHRPSRPPPPPPYTTHLLAGRHKHGWRHSAPHALHHVHGAAVARARSGGGRAQHVLVGRDVAREEAPGHAPIHTCAAVAGGAGREQCVSSGVMQACGPSAPVCNACVHASTWGMPC